MSFPNATNIFDFESGVSLPTSIESMEGSGASSSDLQNHNEEAGIAPHDNVQITHVDDDFGNSDNLDYQLKEFTESSHDSTHDVSNLPEATMINKRGSNKGGKSHKDAYKETHVAFLKLFVEDKPFAEIQYILGLKKAQMDKHVSDAISKGVMPGKPQYRCALWEDLDPEVRATMTNGCKGKLVKIEGDPDSVMITLYDPQLALN